MACEYDRMESTELERADIRGLNLRGADLRGADLRDTDLRDAMFDGARGGIADVVAQRDAVIRDLREQLADLVDERIDALETKLAEAIEDRDKARNERAAAERSASEARDESDRLFAELAKVAAKAVPL